MEVHICTIQITLISCRSSNAQDRTPLQALWRNERTEVVVMGAVRAHPKKGIAVFNEHFEIKTDFLRDPTTHVYHPNIIILEIRHASQSMHETISSSICKLNLSEILNLGPIIEKSFEAQDSSFNAVLSINCSQIEQTGIKRKLSRKSQKRLKSLSSGISNEQSQQIQRQKPRSSSKRKSSEKYQKPQQRQLDKEYQQLMKKYENQQTDHILTQEKLFQAEQSIKQYENLVDQLSATVNQKESFIIEIHEKYEQEKQSKEKNQKENEQLLEKIKKIEQQQGGISKAQIRIKQLQTNLKALKESCNKRIKSENELQAYSEKLQQENHKLTKQIQQLKNDITQMNQEKQQLQNQLKKSEEDKDNLKSNIKQWREQFLQQNRIRDMQIQQKEVQYQKMFIHFSEAKQRLKLIGDHVPRHEIVQIEQFYQEKIKQYQQKQKNMKMHVDTIEVEMNELEQIIQEKESNQQILIDHTKELQFQLDNARAEVQWWNSTIDKQLQLRESALNGTIKQEQQIQERYTKLFNLLKDNSKIILQANKSRKLIERLERKQQELNQKLAISNDQLKEVKERLTVIIKENKKLLEKSNKKHKQYELLSKQHKKLEDQIKRLKQKDKDLQEQNQIYNYRLGIYQKEVKKLRMSFQNQENHIQKTIFEKMTENLTTPMPTIKQDNEDMLFSVPLQNRDQSQQNYSSQNLNPQNIKAVKELTVLIQTRSQFLEQLLKKINQLEAQKQSDNVTDAKEELRNIRALTSKFKLALLRAGQRQAIKEWQSSVRRLSERVEAILIHKS